MFLASELNSNTLAFNELNIPQINLLQRTKNTRPLYSLSKTLVPNLTKILALELSRHKRKIVGVTFEMLDGGMNSNLSLISKQINSDRMLSGQLASMEDAANQIKWIINNPSLLISGSVIDCTGGAIP